MGYNELRRQAGGGVPSDASGTSLPRESTAGIAVPASFFHHPYHTTYSGSPTPAGVRVYRRSQEELTPENMVVLDPDNTAENATLPLLAGEGNCRDEEAGEGEHDQEAGEDSGANSMSQSYHDQQAARDRQYAIGVYASLAVNIVLMISKIYAFFSSGSQAVLASTADSAVDLASQAVLGLASWQMRKEDINFPIGKTRLETIGVIACAIIMGLASYEVLQSASVQLYHGYAHKQYPDLNFGWLMYVILGSTTALKIPLYLYCILLADSSASMGALAEDHRNDVLANITALITAGIASYNKRLLWMMDPIGAVLISLYIMWSWALITKEQLDKLVGHSAPDEFLDEVAEMANSHWEGMGVDVLRAYHFGERYTVEVEVVLPGTMTVMESHDIALDLQHKIEALEDVERAHVHVDYQTRDKPEHKVDRNLNEGWHLNQPHPDYVYITQGGSTSPSGRPSSPGAQEPSSPLASAASG